MAYARAHPYAHYYIFKPLDAYSGRSTHTVWDGDGIVFERDRVS